MKLLDLLKLKEVRNINDLDMPDSTLIHSGIIRKKPFLEKLYFDFYCQLRECLPTAPGKKLIVELGSGGGFIKEVIPGIVTSDVIELKNVDRVFSATNMPFEDQIVDAFVMIDVLHHINDTKKFFNEMRRCLKNGGKVAMIEPANTLWSRFIYRNFHHEPFDPDGGWGFEGKGPLTSANGAIPWIVFYRDRKIFEEEFPHFAIRKLRMHTPLRYIISGGLTLKQLLPSFSYEIVKLFELTLSPVNKYAAMFLTIELEKISGKQRHER